MAPEGYIWDLDRKLLLAINGGWGAGWDNFWFLASEAWFWTPFYVALIGVMWWRFGWRKMLIGLALIVLGLALADQIANFFKAYTPKFRPTRTVILWDGMPYNEWLHTVNGYIGGGECGTVSGHAATSTAIAITGAGICRRWWMWLAAAAYVVLTCFSRLYLGVHFPLDILFGIITGTLISLLMLWIWRLVIRRWGYKLTPQSKKVGCQ